MTTTNPYAAPEADLDSGDPATRDWPGISRLAYWGLSILVQVLLVGLAAGIAASGSVEAVVGVQGLGIIAMLVIAAQRLRNIGNSGWWALLVIVPIANIIIGIRCAAWPTGYVEHRTMDRNGRIILWVLGGIMVLGILAAIALPAYQEYLRAANG